jgi:hypothetical protein
MKQYSAMTGRLAVNFFALPFCRYRLLLVTIIGLLLPGMKGSAQTRRYVDSANTSGTYNGVAWATAYNKLETAITAAAAGDTIWVWLSTVVLPIQILPSISVAGPPVKRY